MVNLEPFSANSRNRRVGDFSFLCLTSGDFILSSNKFFNLQEKKTWQI